MKEKEVASKKVVTPKAKGKAKKSEKELEEEKVVSESASKTASRSKKGKAAAAADTSQVVHRTLVIRTCRVLEAPLPATHTYLPYATHTYLPYVTVLQRLAGVATDQ